MGDVLWPQMGHWGAEARGKDNCHMCDAYEGNPRAEIYVKTWFAGSRERKYGSTQFWLILSGGQVTHDSDEPYGVSVYESHSVLTP